MEFVCGLIGFLFGAVCFLLGYRFGKQATVCVKLEEKAPTEDERSKIEKERERMMEEQAAFRTMMGYNADIAYGRARFSSESEADR